MPRQKKKSAPKVTQQVIEDMVVKYRDLMGLTGWIIQLGFTVSSDDAYADCQPLPQYFKAIINFNLDRITDLEILRAAVIHELMHVQLSLYSNAAQQLAGDDNKKVLEDLEESVVTLIERWPLWSELE